MAKKVNGSWVLNDDPPETFHIQGRATLIAPDDKWMYVDEKKPLMSSLKSTLKHSPQAISFCYLDLTFRIWPLKS